MAIKHDIADGLNESYYQVTSSILGSFNKFRPPLNIYRLLEETVRIVPYYKVGGRLNSEQIEELPKLADDGVIFVSREDHPVYVKHISFQLDLVLVDAHLKESEIADIFVQALGRRLDEFYTQPVPPVMEKLWSDLMVLTEYLYDDIHRTRALVKRLQKEHTLANHALNSGFLGLALFGKLKSNDFEEGGVKREAFNRLTAGLFLHDLGMSKVPPFLLQKDKPLTGEERAKIQQHTTQGYQMLAKLDLKYPEVAECVLDHHERAAGNGYPQKKQGKDLGYYARICAIADSIAAMTSLRPFRKGDPMKLLQAAASLATDKNYDQNMTAALQSLLITDMNMKP